MSTKAERFNNLKKQWDLEHAEKVINLQKQLIDGLNKQVNILEDKVECLEKIVKIRDKQVELLESEVFKHEQS